MHNTTPLRVWGLLALAIPLLLTSCAAEPEASTNSADNQAASTPTTTGSPAPETNAGEDTSASAGSATVHIGDTTFEFALTLCIVGDEDLMAQGPGSNAQTGETAFLEVDFTSFDSDFVGGADIMLGVDQPFASPDDFYRLDPLVNGDGFNVAIAGRAFTAEGQFLAHGEAPPGDGVASHGTLEVRC